MKYDYHMEHCLNDSDSEKTRYMKNNLYSSFQQFFHCVYAFKSGILCAVICC